MKMLLKCGAWMEVEQDLRLGNKMKTHWKTPGRIDELRQGCKGEDIKSDRTFAR